MFKKSAEDSWINSADVMMRVEMKLGFGHTMSVVGTGFIPPS
tara:strand:- start:1788 stop:1913 length:126 start_codon:yes stop_codon:yes gene_type:complete